MITYLRLVFSLRPKLRQGTSFPEAPLPVVSRSVVRIAGSTAYGEFRPRESLGRSWSTIQERAERREGGHVDPVPRDHVDFVIDIAIAAWEDHGATAAEIALLESTPVIIRDFGGNGILGLTTPLGQVVLDDDDDGSGYGWDLQLDVPTDDRYDLVTVIAHEFGHILGRPDLDPFAHPNQLMSNVLRTGDRHDSIDGTDGFFATALDEYLPFE